MPHSRKVTDAVRETIRELTLAGVPQLKIICKVRLSKQTVWKIQRQLGLRQRVPDREPLSRETQDKIITMLRQNVGRVRIARELGVSLDKIDGIARRYRFRRRRGSVGCAYRLSASEISALRRALTHSERSIAKRFHISREWLRHFRVGRFSRRPK